MSKLLLTSVLMAGLLIPLRMARDENPVRGLGRTLIWVGAFNALYLFGLLFVYPRL